MRTKLPMVSRFKIVATLTLFIWLPFCLGGCLSYQILREIDGSEVILPEKPLKIGETSLADVLYRCGAPREVRSLNQYIVMIYQRTVTNTRRLSLGLPFYNTLRGYDISANGGLSKSDSLILVFTSQGILNHYIYEEESQDPFLKTLFQD